jgi:truncated hemoglobin YjbI
MGPNDLGTVGLIRIVTSFYARVLQSPVLRHYFAGVPMEVLVAKQAAFIDTILRGDPGYSPEELHRLHSHLDIDDEGYDELLAILDLTLKYHEVEAHAGSLITESFASFRDAIISKLPA